MACGDNKRLPAIALAVLAAGLAAVMALAAVFADAASASVRTAATEHGKAELIKTVPIAKSAWGAPRSVMSIRPEQLGSLANGDKLKAAGEVELTICLKPDPRHPGDGQPCVGDMYGFNPTLKAKLVLAPDPGASNPSNTKPITRTVSLTCRQDHPVRNHHCVVSVPWAGIGIDTGSLPCEPGKCHVNMLVSAHHPDAGSGHKVVVGSSDDNKRIHQGLGKLSAARFRPGNTKPAKRWRGGRATKKIPVVSKNQSIRKKVIYSARVSNLKAGDQLVVDAKARTKIGHLPYNVFQRTEVVLARKKGSIKQYGKVAESTSRISASNGLNCTRGKSGHSDTCTIRKSGILSVKKNAKGPFFVNVVAGQHAIGTAPQYTKWRSSHKAKIPKSGWVKVERYKGSGSCSTCATGWVGFSPTSKPQSDKPAKLVQQLSAFGIDRGAYNCKWRRDPREYVCKWTAEGKIGSAPRWECSSKAWYRKKAGNFKLNVCKAQLAAQLWDRLTKMPVPVDPDFTGVCDERADGEFRCKWYGVGSSLAGDLAGKFCKGFGTYKISSHSWRIDPCTNPNV